MGVNAEKVQNFIVHIMDMLKQDYILILTEKYICVETYKGTVVVYHGDNTTYVAGFKGTQFDDMESAKREVLDGEPVTFTKEEGYRLLRLLSQLCTKGKQENIKSKTIAGIDELQVTDVNPQYTNLLQLDKEVRSIQKDIILRFASTSRRCNSLTISNGANRITVNIYRTGFVCIIDNAEEIEPYVLTTVDSLKSYIIEWLESLN